MTPLEQVAPDLDLAAAIDLLPHGFIALDLSLHVFFASRGAHDLFGYEHGDEMIGRSALDLLHPGDLDRVTQLFLNMTDDVEARLAEPSIARHVEMSVRVLHSSGRWMSVGATGRLVSETGPFFLSVRPNEVNRTVEDLLHGLALGYTTDQLIGIVAEMATAQFPGQAAWIVSDLATGGHRLRGDVPLPEVVIDEGVSRDERIATIGGGRYWSVAVDDADGRRIGLVIITNHRRGADPSPYDVDIMSNTAQVASLVLQRELADQALRVALSSDTLTGAANRATFADVVDRLGPDDLPVALIYVDIDGFKAINDNLGHPEGDRVLRRTSERLRRAVRGEDIVARLGGDEFAVLCRRLDSGATDQVIARVRGVLDIHPDDAHPDDPQSSVGYATATTVADLADLVDRADADMYRHKRARRG